MPKVKNHLLASLNLFLPCVGLQGLIDKDYFCFDLFILGFDFNDY